MIQWVSNERATIAKLVEHGRLWIVDKLPPLGLPKHDVWEISAEEGGHPQQIDQALGQHAFASW